jgi:hypothetical protein
VSCDTCWVKGAGTFSPLRNRCKISGCDQECERFSADWCSRTQPLALLSAIQDRSGSERKTLKTLTETSFPGRPMHAFTLADPGTHWRRAGPILC